MKIQFHHAEIILSDSMNSYLMHLLAVECKYASSLERTRQSNRRRLKSIPCTKNSSQTYSRIFHNMRNRLQDAFIIASAESSSCAPTHFL